MTREEAIEVFHGLLNAKIKEAFEVFAPELAESEEERMKKELIEAFELYDIESSWNQIPVKRILAYLEKQKVNTEGDFGRGYDCGYQAGYAVAKNEMKPKVATATLDSEKQKEQKHVEYLPKQKVFDIMNKLTNLSYSERIPIDSEEFVKIHEITSDVNSLLDYPIEQKPAEWSDNFEENIGRLLGYKLTWHSEDGSISSAVFIDDKTLKDICAGIWFYVGKEVLKYPNKELNVSEWSEEDEQMLKNVLFVLESYVSQSESASSPSLIATYPTYYKEIDWLKSLRPSWKPSEEQMLKKSMPTWKRSRNNYEDPCIGSAFEKTGRRYTALYMGGYFIDLDDLFNKLPKEEEK